MTTLGFQDLRLWLDYDPAAGAFVWKKSPGRKCPVGSVAGSLGADGYRRIRFQGINYRAGRLAWLFTHGGWPPEQVDHINRNRGDDRLVNLRLASRAENLWNSPRRKHNKSGFKGVRLKKGLFEARIQAAGTVHHLGYHKSAEQAHEVYMTAAQRLHGKFANGGTAMTTKRKPGPGRSGRPGRPATGKNQMIAIRWPPELLQGIEKYASREMLSRSAALKQIVGKFLIDSGTMKASELRAASTTARVSA